MPQTFEEYMKLARERAETCMKKGGQTDAVASMQSDLNKWIESQNHCDPGLVEMMLEGSMLLMAKSSAEEIRGWLDVLVATPLERYGVKQIRYLQSIIGVEEPWSRALANWRAMSENSRESTIKMAHTLSGFPGGPVS